MARGRMQEAKDMETDKVRPYQSLVLKRQGCQLCDGVLTNPANTDFDTNEIGPYSVWQHNLDADLLIVGRDWGDIGTFNKLLGKNAPGIGAYEFQMDKWLQEYLDMICIPIGHPLNPRQSTVFLTNAVLCLKKSASDLIKESWLKNCGSNFLKPLIEIIKPKKLILTLGKDAYEIVMRLYDQVPGNFTGAVNKAVDKKRPFDLGDGLKLFPVFIPGGQGFISRPPEMQERDWHSISEYFGTF
jgi:DNA polymerase